MSSTSRWSPDNGGVVSVTDGNDTTGVVGADGVSTVQLCGSGWSAAGLPSREPVLSTSEQEVAGTLGNCPHQAAGWHPETLGVLGEQGQRGMSCFIGGEKGVGVMKHDLVKTRLGWQYVFWFLKIPDLVGSMCSGFSKF